MFGYLNKIKKGLEDVEEKSIFGAALYLMNFIYLIIYSAMSMIQSEIYIYILN